MGTLIHYSSQFLNLFEETDTEISRKGTYSDSCEYPNLWVLLRHIIFPQEAINLKFKNWCHIFRILLRLTAYLIVNKEQNHKEINPVGQSCKSYLCLKERTDSEATESLTNGWMENTESLEARNPLHCIVSSPESCSQTMFFPLQSNFSTL